MPKAVAQLFALFSMLANAVRENPEPELGGVALNNYPAVFAEGRAKFLRSIKIAEGHEHWIVSMKKGILRAKFEAAMEKKGVELYGHADGFPFVSFAGTFVDLGKVLEEVGDDVEQVEPDMPTHLLSEVHSDVAEVGRQDPVAQDYGCLHNMNLIGREHRTSTGKGVHVYVLDTGIRISHSEFRDSRAVGDFHVMCGLACKNLDCNEYPNSQCDLDLHGHGTHVAGTVGGLGLGVAPGASLHSVRILDENGGGAASWFVAGIDYVIAKGQKPGILSMSIGMPRTNSYSAEAAVESAIDSGFTVVVASGNEGASACGYVPAAVSPAITVGSMTQSRWLFSQTEVQSDFSNHGGCVDLLAPGEDILSSLPNHDSAVGTMTGTSMACPHVSGVAALILEENATFTPAEVQSRLMDEFIVEGRVSNLNGSPNKRLSVGPSSPPCDGSHRHGVLAAVLLTLLAGRVL